MVIKGQKSLNPPNTNIWVGNLPANIDKDELTAIFSRFGDISSARVFPPKGNGRFASAMMRTTTQERRGHLHCRAAERHYCGRAGVPHRLQLRRGEEGDAHAAGGARPPRDAAPALRAWEPRESPAAAPRWSGGGALGPPGDGGKGGGAKGPGGKGGKFEAAKGSKGGKGDGGKGKIGSGRVDKGDTGKGTKGRIWPGAGKGGRADAGRAGDGRPAIARTFVKKGPDGKEGEPAVHEHLDREPPCRLRQGPPPPRRRGYGEILSCRLFPPKKPGGQSSAMARLATQDPRAGLAHRGRPRRPDRAWSGRAHQLQLREGPALRACPGDRGTRRRRARLRGQGGRRTGAPHHRGADSRADHGGYGKAPAGGARSTGGHSRGWLKPKGADTAGSNRASHPYGGKGARAVGAIGAIGAIGAVGSSSSASAAAKEAPKKLPPLSRDQLVAAALADGLLGGSDTAPEAKLFVKNLPGDMDDLGLYRLFSPFGALVPGRVKAMAWPDGKCKGHGFVDFAEQLAAEQAMTALHGFEGLHVVQAEATGRSAPAPAAAPQPDEEDEDERAFQDRGGGARRRPR
ncbi:unnamed protein product [Prorocentrum cordatum]|uniref:RRM domain-containing protein n=1 Tax=Prorocentrum cordatum TaxID=2364126 RepID=A0ABN9UYW2_9DINO|nr:unnamed protein product [Polarella glacialis]